MTGCARLATQVHMRKAALEDRIAADCLLAVCRVAEKLEAPILADLVTLRERMWGRLLDHSRVERLHVSEADYPSHMTEPIPVEQVGGAMSSRDWQWSITPGKYPIRLELEDADGTCDNLITLRAHMLVRHQFGKTGRSPSSNLCRLNQCFGN